MNLGKIYYRPTLTLTSHLRQNVGLREGQVGNMMIMIQKSLRHSLTGSES